MSDDDDAPHLALAAHLELTPRSDGGDLEINGRRNRGDLAARDALFGPIESSAGATREYWAPQATQRLYRPPTVVRLAL